MRGGRARRGGRGAGCGRGRVEDCADDCPWRFRASSRAAVGRGCVVFSGVRRGPTRSSASWAEACTSRGRALPSGRGPAVRACAAGGPAAGGRWTSTQPVRAETAAVTRSVAVVVVRCTRHTLLVRGGGGPVDGRGSPRTGDRCARWEGKRAVPLTPWSRESAARLVRTRPRGDRSRGGGPPPTRASGAGARGPVGAAPHRWRRRPPGRPRLHVVSLTRAAALPARSRHPCRPRLLVHRAAGRTAERRACPGVCSVARLSRASQSPVAPSRRSRRRSAWPLWRAYSSIMWV